MKNAIKVMCFVLAMLLVGAATCYFAFVWDLTEFAFIDGAEKGTVIITGYIGDDTDVEIPNTLRGKKVVAISEFAFRNDEITSLKIGNNVKTIGDAAFNGCKKLKSVDLGKSVETIGNQVFTNCTELTEFKFSPVLKEIGYLTFGNVEKITDIDLNGNNNFKIDNGVIYNSDMTVIYETLISADLSDYTMPESVSELRYGAFYHQSEMTSIKLSPNVQNIPTACFAACENLTELTIPEGVKSIEESILIGSSITTIEIPGSVIKIDDNAFAHNQVTILDEEGNPVLDENGKEVKEYEHKITIVTIEGSFGATLARRNGYELKLVEAL